ncbi:Gfo/Idh/MocA family oxidoreductase [Actinotalea sp.]|uniref:Gfo/Idh/MocA family protein n=1 Tax=Actinotalea sp. TaxID=1872145 RepID=UPI002BE96F01|nr:Gfo/Idh/MocA family oxidoreductase [Actinotalea sp.]HQY34274.1 Gfo/Idh/MocA family oxidoreductase [Actinotalea sp.]HRA50523.1 Gfo/Idh/MocA family oxidoreductase [Actinotalea sp.]
MAHQHPRLRVAVVGYGMAGRLIHSPLIEEAGHHVVDVVTSDVARGAAARAELPEVRVHADLDALLARAGADARSRPDVVVLATPTGSHVEHALAVVAAGLPVVVDKPIALDEAGARRVVEAAEAAGVPLTVFHNRRWDDEQRTLAGLLDAGTLGTVHRFERRWERWRPVPKDRWRENAVGQGGGLLLDLGAHLVDSAVQLFGPVTSVHAELRSLTTLAEDDVFLALTHAGGTISHLSAGSLVGAPGPRTRVLGSDGAFLVTRFEGEEGPFDAMDPGPGMAGWHVHGAQRSPVPCAPGGHADFYRAVGPWLTGGAPPPVDPWDAVRTAVVLDAARRSATTGLPVALPG